MKKIVRSMIMMSTMMLVAISAKAEAFAKTYEQKVGSAKITYTYEFEKGSNTNVKITGSTVTGASSPLDIKVPESIPGDGKTLKIVRICDAAFKERPIKSIQLPMSLKYLEQGSLDCVSNDFKTVYVPETIASVHELTFSTVGGKYSHVENLYIRKKDGSNIKIDSVKQVKEYTDKMYVIHSGDRNCFKICDKSGNETIYPMVELFTSLGFSPMMQPIVDEYATQVIKEIIPSGVSEAQKIQLIYNYVISHTRYCDIFKNGSSVSTYTQAPYGAFFTHSAVCGGRARTFQVLAKKAGLDVEYVSHNKHAWNLFRPKGKSEYYLIDTCNCVCLTGRKAGEYTMSDEDEKKFKVAKDYYGDCIEVQVLNKSTQEFNITLKDTDHPERKYINYFSNCFDDEKAQLVGNITKTRDLQFFAYAHAYYTLTIDQGSKNCLKLDIALNRGKEYTSSFKDSKGVTHNYKITYQEDSNLKSTKYKSRYIIEITN